MRPDLNDYFYYAAVVKHSGFAAAGRALREAKSKLSRRISGLEERLGVRLIERSSRRFRVTDAGQIFYARCQDMLMQVEQAEALMTEVQSEPHGLIRFSCPTGLVSVISESISTFLERYPKVRLQCVAVDRPVDLIDERIDLALRVRTSLDSDASLTMRSLSKSVRILVANPQVASRIAGIEQLDTLPTLSTSDDLTGTTWYLETDDGRAERLSLEPRLGCSDLVAVRNAAISGLGVALLPDHVCRDALEAGKLVHVLPAWRGRVGLVHLVFTTRRGLPPAVRKFIDHLVERFPRKALNG